MSQHQQPQQNVYVVQNPTNGLGTAGFVLSLVGLFFTCGFLSPLGLILSFIALFKSPRGMAAAGVVVGLLGSWWLFAFGFVMVAGLMGVAAAVPAAQEAARQAEEAEKQRMEYVHQQEQAIRDEQASTSSTDAPMVELPDEPSAVTPLPSLSEPMPTPEQSPIDKALSELPDEPTKPTDPDVRTWISANGKFSIEAEFVSYSSGKVRLKKTDGNVIEMDEDKLSDADREWLRERRGQ